MRLTAILLSLVIASAGAGAAVISADNNEAQSPPAVVAANPKGVSAGRGLGFHNYVFYKQCNTSWGEDRMGVDGPGQRNTICNEGCAMSCVAMVMATLGVREADGELVTPGTFNKWLVDNKGYHCDAGDCNNLNLTFPEIRHPAMRLIGELPKPSFAEIAAGLALGHTAYIAHVRNRHHFVLLLSPASGSGFLVRDPAFDQNIYDYSQISGIIMYSIPRSG